MQYDVHQAIPDFLHRMLVEPGPLGCFFCREYFLQYGEQSMRWRLGKEGARDQRYA
jgi:hypothetical protein